MRSRCSWCPTKSGSRMSPTQWSISASASRTVSPSSRWATGAGTVDLRPPRDSSYAAIYYPFIRVVNPLSLDYPLIPPSGHIAGIYARTDIERGVHKAPAKTRCAAS